MHYPIAQKIVKLIRLLIYIYTKISSLRQPGRAIAHIILALLAIEAIRRVSFTSNSPFSETLTRYELSVQPDLDKPNCDPIDRNKLRENMGVQIDGRVYPPTLALSFNNSFNFTCLMQNSVTKRILVWIPFFASSTIKRDDDSLKKSNCPVTNCEVTHDRSKLRSSDMVYAHIVSSLKGPNKLPTHRPRAQRWIFGIYESPVHSPVFSQFNSYFNLSSTYSIHSDFPNFYRNSFDQQFVWRKNLTFNRSFNYAKDKSILAFALISNQWDKSKRLRVIEEMQAHMPVRLFGSVGETCLPGVDCKEYLVSEAKFYLAFENSVCDEYITEKFFDTLKHNIVPVVLGGGDYELHIPKSSFINVLDYKSIKDLTDHLKYLDKNDTAYNEFFKWKEFVSVNPRPGINVFVPFCDMCIFMNLERFYGQQTAHTILNDMDKFHGQREKCKMVSFEHGARLALQPYRKRYF